MKQVNCQRLTRTTVAGGSAVDGALRRNSAPEPAVTVWSEPVREVRGLVRGCSHSDLPRLRGEPPTWTAHSAPDWR